MITVNYEGGEYTVREAAKIAQCSNQAIRKRINNNWPPSRILATEQRDPQASGRKGGLAHGYKRGRNKNCLTVKFRGKDYTVSEIASLTGCSDKTIRQRIEKDWSPSKVLTKGQFPTNNAPKIFINHEGKKYTIREAAKFSGATESAIRARVKAGWDSKKILNLIPPMTKEEKIAYDKEWDREWYCKNRKRLKALSRKRFKKRKDSMTPEEYKKFMKDRYAAEKKRLQKSPEKVERAKTRNYAREYAKERGTTIPEELKRMGAEPLDFYLTSMERRALGCH
jgi:predicted transcriptional regulator